MRVTVVGIQPKVQLLLLRLGEGDFLRDFRDTVPDVLNQQDAFRNAKGENVFGD
jgi:hypothetical protein